MYMSIYVRISYSAWQYYSILKHDASLLMTGWKGWAWIAWVSWITWIQYKYSSKSKLLPINSGYIYQNGTNQSYLYLTIYSINHWRNNELFNEWPLNSVWSQTIRHISFRWKYWLRWDYSNKGFTNSNNVNFVFTVSKSFSNFGCGLFILLNFLVVT